jgi:benzoyl-CoA reductase/2-hydroxyglutaryl-CoA dehydratase subunit BcrC/BadD/HgdB
MRTDVYAKKESNKYRSEGVKTEQTKPQAFKKIQATNKMKEIMEQHFRELDEAARTKSRKIAWCTSVGPAELLRAAGFLVFFPENHGAMLGSTRMATDLIPIANALGYSPDICSYLTSDIGSYIKGESPISKAYPGISGPPRPDVLVYNTNQCRDVQDWYNFYSREFKVPVIGVETHRGVGDITKAHVDSISAQIKALVPKLEEISGQKLDYEEFRHVVSFSRQCTDLWKQVLQIASNVPSPLTFFDGTIQMGPAVVLRGEQRAVDYYKLLLAELRQRVQDGIAAIDDEKFRLYWEGMPIWGKLRELSAQFAGLNTCVLASTYCSSWVFPALDPDDPFDSMARAYIELFIVRNEEYKERYFEREIDLYKIDGMIFHDAKTCPNNSNNRYGLPERLSKKYNMPMLVLHGDLNDLRCYSEEQARTNIEAFIEQLAERKGR